MGTHPDSALVSDLVDTLWFERRLLEYLLFKLVSANLVLAAEDRRFVAPAVGEVEKVMEQVRAVELSREQVVAKLAGEWRVEPATLTLAYLAEHAPPAHQSAFDDHRGAFLDLVGEIEELTKENRRLATVGLDGIRGTLNVIEGSTPGAGYDATGRPRVETRAPAKIDEVL